MLCCSAVTFYEETYYEYFRVHVNHRGRVIWAFGGKFETSCEMDTLLYPFDLQKCPIVIANWIYTASAVDLVNGSMTVPTDQVQEQRNLGTGQVHCGVGTDHLRRAPGSGLPADDLLVVPEEEAAVLPRQHRSSLQFPHLHRPAGILASTGRRREGGPRSDGPPRLLRVPAGHRGKHSGKFRLYADVE